MTVLNSRVIDRIAKHKSKNHRIEPALHSNLDSANRFTIRCLDCNLEIHSVELENSEDATDKGVQNDHILSRINSHATDEHEIELAYYGLNSIENIALECMHCHTVLHDIELERSATHR